jgi:hypothetical protein
MNRRNFLQLLGAVALTSMVGIKPMTYDEMRRQLDAEFQRNLDDLARRYDEWAAQHRAMDVESLGQMGSFWRDNVS